MGYDVTTFFPFEIKNVDWSAKLTFCFWPRRCWYSNKRIWFKKAYIGTAWFRIDTQLLSCTIYADKNQFIIHQLS